MSLLDRGRDRRLRYYGLGNSAKLHLLFAVLSFCVLCPRSRYATAYSLLTHEQLFDLTWAASIVPLLLSRYPTLTPAKLEQARAYAYGGCIIQAIGYYPYGTSHPRAHAGIGLVLA
jgi:hypothetical protein